MIYPHGTLTLDKLRNMLKSDQYEVYAESTVAPENWDPNTLYRGPRTKIKSYEDALKYLADPNITICYDITDKYYQKHPYAGEAKMYIKELFHWQYSGVHPYAISETKCRCRDQEYTSLELLRYGGDFNDSCWVIAYWTRDDEGYEFKSVGSRLFTEIDADDLETVWEAITAADKYLRNKFNSIEQYTNGGV